MTAGFKMYLLKADIVEKINDWIFLIMYDLSLEASYQVRHSSS